MCALLLAGIHISTQAPIRPDNNCTMAAFASTKSAQAAALGQGNLAPVRPSGARYMTCNAYCAAYGSASTSGRTARVAFSSGSR